ncbi:MAG: M23 family metallopeptidase [Bacteroidales bacterium]
MKLFLLTICWLLINIGLNAQNFLLPVQLYDRSDLSLIQLTPIGKFGEIRKERPGVPEHYHTGIDIKRPKQNYKEEPIYSIGQGVVLSIRNDGPYALIIIEHNNNGNTFWTEYEHVAGIKVEVGDFVTEKTQIARFMNSDELNQYGWQFDHFHFEIFKVPPMRIVPKESQPQHIYNTFNLICYTMDDLDHYYFNPIPFLKELMY